MTLISASHAVPIAPIRARSPRSPKKAHAQVNLRRKAARAASSRPHPLDLSRTRRTKHAHAIRPRCAGERRRPLRAPGRARL